MAWPSAIHHVPNPCLKKGDGEFPLEQRLLSVTSVWYYAWAANAYRALDGWRAQRTHNASYGAAAGSTIQDVAWGLALRIEAAHHGGTQLGGLALDRKKRFDLLTSDLVVALQLHAGCPPAIVELRRNLYDNVKRYVRLGTAYAEAMAVTNGHLQGCPFSIDDIKLLMYVWTQRQHNAVPRSLSATYIDDSNSTVTDRDGAEESIRQSELFDRLSGQEVQPGKVVAWATHPRLKD